MDDSWQSVMSCRISSVRSSKRYAARAEKSSASTWRRHKLLAVGNKADRVDAHKLAELLPCGQLKLVYHGMPGVRRLKELVHSYDSLVSDTIRG